MNSLHRVMVGGGVAVVTFDAAMSLASKRFAFDYTSAIVGAGSLGIYLAVGFFAADQGNRWSSAIAGASTGFIDATLGWWISWIILGAEFGPRNFVVWTGTVVAVVTLTSVFGTVGGGIARLFKRRRSLRPNSPLQTDEPRRDDGLFH